MPSARYWKLSGMTAHGGGDVELSELQFYDDATLVADPVSLTFTNTGVSGTPDDLLDDDPSTTFRFNPAPAGAALIADFGGSLSPRVTALRLGSGTVEARFLSQVDLFYSTDGAQWTREASIGRYPWPGAEAMTPAPSVGDASYANVAVLLHGDGSDGSTTATDNSPSPKTFSAVGNAQVSTAQSKYGGASLKFDGNGDYFTCAASSDFAFPGDFTIEFWARKSADGSAGYDTALTTDTSDGSAVSGWFCELSAVRGFLFAANGAAVTSHVVDPNDSTWHHWVVCRSGSTLRMFLDGALVSSVTYATAIAADGLFGVGGSAASASYRFNGYIDDLRITKGVARYTTGFTPPETAFPNSGSSEVFDPIPVYTKPGGELPTFFREDIAGTVGAYAPVGTQRVRDIYLAGRGSITATVKEDGTPTDTPVRRKVRLVRDRDGLMVRETWSNATTGAYSFTEIDENETYSVVSYDHNDNLRAVIADRITPTVA